MVNAVVPGAQLLSAARAIADEVLACAPLSVQASKQVMLQSLDESELSTALGRSYCMAERMLASEDAVEGPRAFAEKRIPVWKGC
jgi:crotonobetainyl-CoA hydratase